LFGFDPRRIGYRGFRYRGLGDCILRRMSAPSQPKVQLMSERIDGRLAAVGHSADRKSPLDFITFGCATISPNVLADFFPGCEALGGWIISHVFYKMQNLTV
jgi:hypothetical protein